MFISHMAISSENTDSGMACGMGVIASLSSLSFTSIWFEGR